MPPSMLAERLVGVGHLGELSRLLSVFSEPRRTALGKRELIELANRTAGAGYRYPNPVAALDLALMLGLVRQRGHFISLTNIGRSFLGEPRSNPTDLDLPQGKLLLALLLDDDTVTHNVASLLRVFRQGVDGRLQARSALLSSDKIQQDTAKLLQQLGALEYRDELFLLTSEFESILPPGLIESAKLSEETLWKRLEAQRQRAKMAEELVVSQEVQRLTELGRRDLAELVFRVSTVDAAAGYDIASFEIDDSPRYIEVKSSTGTRIRFWWSIGERQRAQELRDRYWIYFVPMAHALPHILSPTMLIQNPISHILSGALVEAPSTYVVVDNLQMPVDPDMKFFGSARTIHWLSHR